MSQKLEIAELSAKLQELVDKTNKILDETNNKELKEKLEKELNALKQRTDLKVAFVGQYNSGKSTIISALTGNKDIKIDANVATDTVSQYKWNNIALLDTPGILAGKLERHDQNTKEALKDSDLIVYVITSQLFDDIIFENFIDLAYTQALKDKMLISVNKMSMERGEFEVLKKNYYESIKDIFKERGYDFDFEIVFMDAADYIEGVEDDDNYFIEMSNFNKFITTLNDFVSKKGLIKRQFDTPVRLLRSIISDIALAEFDPNLQALLEQGVKKIKASKASISRSVDLEILRFEQEIKNQGYKLGNMIGDVSEEEFKQKQENYELSVKEKYKEVGDKIEELIATEEENLVNLLDDFENKEAVIAYQKSIDAKLEAGGLNATQIKNLKKQKSIIDFLNDGNSGIVSKSVGNAALGGLKGVSGSVLHKRVMILENSLDTTLSLGEP